MTGLTSALVVLNDVSNCVFWEAFHCLLLGLCLRLSFFIPQRHNAFLDSHWLTSSC